MDYEKKFVELKDYSSIFIINSLITKEDLEKNARIIFDDNKKFGKVLRIKGFIKEDNKYYFINMTKNELELRSIEKGQDVLIIIGEELNENNIKEKLDV